MNLCEFAKVNMYELTSQHSFANTEQYAEPTGWIMFDGRECPYADAIKSGDLVAANFDVKDAHTGGGLYLL